MNKIYVGKHKWFDADCLNYVINTEKIDWVNSVGCKVEFECHGVHGFYTIVSVQKDCELTNNSNRQYLYKIYFNENKDEVYIVTRKALRDLKFSYILNVYSGDFLYKIGEIVNEKFEILKQISKKYYKNDKACVRVYQCKCLVDGYVFEIPEYELEKRMKCPVCASYQVAVGVNDIQTLKPEIVKYLVNKEDAIKHVATTTKLLDFKCDICGREFKASPSCFSMSFPCGCYSAQSYPNRFIRETFNQLNIPYIHELRETHFEWCGKYRYDLFFELNNNKYIIEMDGGQHKYNLDTDKEKDELAFNNGVYVIRIDCDYKNANKRFSYIRDNIINSELSKIIDLSFVNWQAINVKILTTSLTKEVCDLRNKGYTNGEIANQLGVSKSTVIEHLRYGNEIGITLLYSTSGNAAIWNKVMMVTNLETNEVRYYVGLRQFYDNSITYLGFNMCDSYFKRHRKNGCVIRNGYSFTKITYNDFLKKTLAL